MIRRRFLTDGTYTVEKATFDTEWVVGEEVHNFYIQANIDGDLGSMSLCAATLACVMRTLEQSSTGTIGGGFTNTVE